MSEPFFGHEWFAEFFVRDLEEIADKMRRTADFLDGKAALLHRQMYAAASADTRPEGGDSTEIEAPFTSGAVAKPDAQAQEQNP